jgi:benzoyl-CoA reductase subunit D
MNSVTVGIDAGTSVVKAAVIAFDNGTPRTLALMSERFRRRDMREVVRGCYERILEKAGVKPEDIGYIASTGSGNLVEFRSGHFYGMTTHARGANFLEPRARTVLDVGALHARAIRINEQARVLSYKMTAQCASGSGQFIENIARYLGVPLRQVGPLSLTATEPEQPSGICAVLSETDVINMVSRGVGSADILKGIHLSVAQRLARTLSAVKVVSPVLVTGGLAADAGLVAALGEKLVESGIEVEVLTHPDSMMAGALGAALWAEWRMQRMAS